MLEAKTLNLFCGFVTLKGERPVEKFKGRSPLKGYDEIKNQESFGAVLAKDTVAVEIADDMESEIMSGILVGQGVKCRIYKKPDGKGRLFIFKNSKRRITRNYHNTAIAAGIRANVKTGSVPSYIPLKVDGCEYTIEFDSPEYDTIPCILQPIRWNGNIDSFQSGSDRNQKLFEYIKAMQRAKLSIDEIRDCIDILNSCLLTDPFTDKDVQQAIQRDEIQIETFFIDRKFQFDKFALWTIDRKNIVRIEGELYCFNGKYYEPGAEAIEKAMVDYISNLPDRQRKEVLKYMMLKVEIKEQSPARYIAFNNGVYDIVTHTMQPHTPNFIITNLIPWNYNPGAYSEIMDNALNDWSCNNSAVRSLIEELIGYCLYRANDFEKSFILTGDGANGKSTFLDCVRALLGGKNCCSLDLSELGDRFSTVRLKAMLANIGDDIEASFLTEKQLAKFKKLVSGNVVSAERKGVDGEDMRSYAKLIFSANEVPKMQNFGKPLRRRLVVIPFDANFGDSNDPYLKYKLCEREAMEYLITLAVAALERILKNRSFTKTDKSEELLNELEVESNSVAAFCEAIGEADVLGRSPRNCHNWYTSFCEERGLLPVSQTTFTKRVCSRYHLKTENINKERIFVEKK